MKTFVFDIYLKKFLRKMIKCLNFQETSFSFLCFQIKHLQLSIIVRFKNRKGFLLGVVRFLSLLFIISLTSETPCLLVITRLFSFQPPPPPHHM